MKPLISVVTAVYNTEKYLDKAINSVLCQTFQDFEYIIVDDGSTDRSPEILQEYASRYPEKIRLHRQTNKGAYHAYNKCTELAKGQYIFTLNSDDYLSEDCLEIVSSYVIKHGVDVVFINTATHAADEEQNIVWKDMQSIELKEEFIILSQEAVRLSWPSIMRMGLVRNNINLYKADIMKKHPYYTGYYGADYLLNIEIADEIKSIACHPKILYHNFYYIGNTAEGRNISEGKYYPYLHEMHNEFYLKNKALFDSWNILSDEENRQLLANTRINQFKIEVRRINAWNNKMSSAEKVFTLASYFDDVLSESTAVLNCRRQIEKLILDACGEQNLKADLSQGETLDHYMTHLLYAINTEDLPPEVRENTMLGALTDKNNPYSLGLLYYERYSKTHPNVFSMDVVEYFFCRERARGYVLTGRHELAADEITLLFNAPFSDPEKYLLLCMNCFNFGFSDDAISIAALGLEKFPDYQRLIDASMRFSSIINSG